MTAHALKTIVAILLISKCTDLLCQHHEVHAHPQSELGVTVAPFYYLEDQSVHFGINAHYTHMIGDTDFGFGVGYECLKDENQHQDYCLVLQYNPTHRIHLIAAPGVALEREKIANDVSDHYHRTALPTIHFEAVYEFPVDPLVIGPTAEYSVDPNHAHVSLGLHLGVPF